MDYRLYHDESKQGGYWHGMLLVPENGRQEMYERLMEIRNAFNVSHTLGIKSVRSAAGPVANTARSWLQLGTAALSSDFKGKPLSYQLQLDQTVTMTSPIGAKFIAFRKKGDHSDMTVPMSWASAVETTARMGLKGGLHCLGSTMQPIRIVRMHFDGHEHYQRHLDKNRIVSRMVNLREYCSIDDASDLIVDGTSDHTREGCQDHIDCQFLQLTDLLIGSFRSVLGTGVRPEHQRLVHPVKSLVERYQKGAARMSNSRWENSFWLSQCELVDGRWLFSEMEYQANARSAAIQTSLF